MKKFNVDFLLLLLLICCALYFGIKIYLGFFETQIIVK
jgi:hypothetical protein